jgi:hypothetical protein
MIQTIFGLIFLLITGFACSQTNNGLQGVWKGTSICQLKNSPCHDENVVYHISRNENGSFAVVMNKVINNKEEEMGTLIFSYDSAHQILSSVNEVQNSRWDFKVKGLKLEGTLMYKNNLYRIIDVKKEE